MSVSKEEPMQGQGLDGYLTQRSYAVGMDTVLGHCRVPATATNMAARIGEVKQT